MGENGQDNALRQMIAQHDAQQRTTLASALRCGSQNAGMVNDPKKTIKIYDVFSTTKINISLDKTTISKYVWDGEGSFGFFYARDLSVCIPGLPLCLYVRVRVCLTNMDLHDLQIVTIGVTGVIQNFWGVL